MKNLSNFPVGPDFDATVDADSPLVENMYLVSLVARVSCYRDLYRRIAREGAVSVAHVSKVAHGKRQSRRIAHRLKLEYARIERAAKYIEVVDDRRRLGRTLAAYERSRAKHQCGASS